MGEPPSGGKHGVIGGIVVYKMGQVLGMDRPAAADGRPLVEHSKRVLMALHAIIEETGVLTRGETWNERLQRRPHIPHHADLYRVTAAEVSRVDVDLHDSGVIGIELAPGEIAAEQQQRVARHQGVVTGRRPDDPGHANVERVVVFDEILGPRRVRDRRLQTIGEGHDLIMGALTSRPTIDRNPRAGVQHFRDAVEIGVAGMDHRLRNMHRKGGFVRGVGLGDVDRQDQHGDATF
jgi:hypothetical protein